MTDERRGIYIPQDWLGQDLSADELILLARLDSYWRSYRVAYPSDQFLAQQLGFHPRKIQRLMVSLSEKGWIKRVGSYSQKRRGGQYREVHPTERSRPSPQEVVDNSVDRVVDRSVERDIDKSVEGEKQSENTLRVNGKGGHLADRFEEWWQHYPKKRGKEPSRKKWRQKRLDERADELIADVQKRKKRDSRWLRGYPPDPHTYLNQERWEDEIEPPQEQSEAGDPFAGAL